MKTAVLIILRIVSSLSVLGFLYYLYGIMPDNDWKPNLEKFLVFLIFFVTIAGFEYHSYRRRTPNVALLAESALLLVIFASFFYSYSAKWVPGGFIPPVADYGFMVVDATKMLFVDGENPYSSQTISPIKDIFGPEYRGFYYGPLMMVGYLPTLVSPAAGYKYTSIFFVLLSGVLLAFLVVEPEDRWELRLANIAFVETAFFLPERMWIELFSRGAHDYFPVALLLAGLLALKKGNPFWTGILVGLSFSAKFSPAVFVLPFLPYRDRKVLIGLFIGLLPHLPFFLWDPPAFVRNVFLVRFVMPHDGSSFRWLLAPEYHWWLPTALLLGLGYAIYRNIRGPLEFRTVVVGLTLLLIVGETTFKQVHLNHLIWFFPLFALLFTYNREKVFGFLAGIFGNRLAANPETP